MSGVSTNNVPLASIAAGTFPFTGNERLLVDTQLAGGVYPQSEALTLSQLASLGFGNVSALTDAATITADLSTASYFSVTMGGNRTFVFSNPSPGQEFLLEVKQDATGSRTATWPATVRWASGTAPTLTTTAGATDILRFTYNAALVKFIGETVAKAVA